MKKPNANMYLACFEFYHGTKIYIVPLSTKNDTLFCTICTIIKHSKKYIYLSF